MGEVLHEVFIAHYEEAYKKKLIEVNEDLALKHKLSGNKSDKAPQKIHLLPQKYVTLFKILPEI